MAYNQGSLRRESDAIYQAIMTGTMGSGIQSPFTSPYTSSTWSGSEPSGFSLIADLILSNTLGIKNLLHMPAWNEPKAGELGAYAYSRFRANQGAMGLAGAYSRRNARSALGSMLVGNQLTRSIFGFDDRDVEGIRRSFADDDQSGFPDLGANLVKQFMGLEDYGYAGIRAAQQRGGFLLSGMSRDANRMLTDINPISSNWAAREASVIGEYQRRAHDLMYEGDTFLRNENFMRGFKETDLAPILERAAASAGGSDDLGRRMKEVGGAAIKTLEAFKDLFGNADTAKQLLNQMTAGGWSGMSAASFERMTNNVRGLMRLGEVNGLGPQAVAGMLMTGQRAVQTGMGYTPSDVAGGYANQNVVNGVASGFVAQRLADARLSQAQLDPVEMQRLQARSTWRALEFSKSTAGRSMMAYEFAIASGALNEGSDQAREIAALFRSGNQGAMARAARITAGILGVDMERLQSDSFYKMAADAVGRDARRLAEYSDLGVSASDEEDRIRVERSFANEAVDMAKRRAKAGGVGQETVTGAERRARLGAIRSALERAAPGSEMARMALEDLDAAALDQTKNDAELLRMADRLVEAVGPEFASVVRTDATAAAAREISNLADSRRVSGFTSSNRALATAVDFIVANGGDVSGGVRRSDAVMLGRALYDTGLFEGDEDLKRFVTGSDAMSDDEIRSTFERLGDRVLYAKSRGVSFNRPDFGDLGTSMKFGGDIADMIGGGVEVRNYWTDGGRGTIDDFGTIVGGLDALVEFTGVNRKERYEKAKTAIADKTAERKSELEESLAKIEQAAALVGEGSAGRNALPPGTMENNQYAGMSLEELGQARRSVEGQLENLQREAEDEQLELDRAYGSDSEFDRKVAKFRESVEAYRRAEASNDTYGAEAARRMIRGFASDLSDELSGMKIDGDVLRDALRSVPGFEGVTDVKQFLTALSGDDGEGTDITFSGKHMRADQVYGIFEKAASGLGVEGLENPFEGLSGEDIAKRISDIQKRGEGASEAEREYLKALQGRIAMMGTEARAVADSVLRPDSAFGTVAMSGIVEGFGGELVAADNFTHAAMNLGEKSGMSVARVAEIGKQVQKVVDDNAVEAYTTASQAILRGLTTRSEKDIGKAVDMFLSPGATQEQKAQFLAKLKSWVDGLGTDKNGNKRTAGQVAEAVFEGVASGEVDKIAQGNSDYKVQDSQIAEWRDKAKAVSDFGTSEEKPLFVQIVNAEPVPVQDVEN